MKINTISPLIFHRINGVNVYNINSESKSKPKITNQRPRLPYVNAKLALISFYGDKKIKPASRLETGDYRISKYIAEIGKARYLHGDKAVVDMSMGNPDLTPPEKAKQALKEKVNDLWSHRYNNPKGDGFFLNTAADWMKKRFNVDIDPRKEIMVTSGSSDAIDHILTAYAEHGDKILMPDPGYSLYDDLITRHDLKKISYKIYPQNGYLPDFSNMPKDAKIMILNYPHNPTGSFAPKKTFEEAVKFAKENGILLIHDMDNSEITHTGKKPAGIMQVDGAKDVAFEVHTFSKAQSMPGLRVAFAVSSKDNIDNLLKAKYLSGGSVYIPVQAAAAEALKDEEGYINKINKIYRNRKNTAIKRLHELGSDAAPTSGTYYLWAKIPPDFRSDEFFKYVLHKSQIAFTPGDVFGDNGDGYVRIVMSANENQINEAFDRIKKAGIRFDISKLDLPAELQKEIASMADGSYTIKPKQERDFDAYIKLLPRRREQLIERLKDQDPKLMKLVPQKDLQLPWNILKDGQSVYLQNVKEGHSVFGEIHDILPYSDRHEYSQLAQELKQEWKQSKYPEANILPPYKSGILYPDAVYFVLKADNKIQALANIEVQDDGCVWGRSLNTAPWNQGRERTIKNSAKAVIARMVSYCLETGNHTLKFATDNPKNIALYKSIGMKEDGERYFNGVKNTILTFDKNSMEKYLNTYQINLSF